MAKAINRLTARGIGALREPGRYADGNGLYLIVSEGGSKNWVLFYQAGGRRREMGLGGAGHLSLADARAKAVELKREVREGRDPIEERRKKARGYVDGELFGVLADSVVDDLRAGWRGAKTEASWRRSFEKHGASLRSLRVEAITTEHVLEALKPIWIAKPESAKKLAQRLELAFDVAQVKGLRSADNPARWKGKLSLLLPKQPKLVRGHHPAMPFDQVPAFYARLLARDGMSARALEWTLLTASRESMTLNATWDEIDADACLWIISPKRMKSERQHRVPLSTQAIDVLGKIRPPSGQAEGLIFTGAKEGKPLSDMAMDMMMREVAPGYVPHGLRSSFRDWVGDCTAYPREVAEEALAHAVGNEAERAYRRGDALNKRREMMQSWGNYCESTSISHDAANG